jgi:Ni/Fe-hydrogenase 1 B-type cytochrome subunit
MATLYRKLEGEGVTYHVWDAPVRILHWINVIAFAVLLYTGFQITGLVGRSAVDEPAFGFSMANVRNLHYLAAVIFSVNGLFRCYWFFGGKNYRQWFRYNIWQADFWRECAWKLKEYLTLRYLTDEAHTLGHNALASLAYFFAFLSGLVLILTGFAMRGQIDPGGWTQAFFGWVIAVCGSEATVRALHRFAMWTLIGFAIHHVAFVIYLDILRESGLVSSMLIGLKIRPRNWQPREKPWLEHH